MSLSASDPSSIPSEKIDEVAGFDWYGTLSPNVKCKNGGGRKVLTRRRTSLLTSIGSPPTESVY